MTAMTTQLTVWLGDLHLLWWHPGAQLYVDNLILYDSHSSGWKCNAELFSEPDH